jgi:hypothetical protein
VSRDGGNRGAGLGRRCGGIALTIGLALAPVACTPYRIERHTRPAFYQSASNGTLPDRVELKDGTVVEYVTGQPTPPSSTEGAADAKPFEIREEHDDGTVIVRCLLPEHVIANTMTCLRNREYKVMWEQLLAASTRQAYTSEGLTFDDFADFMDEARPEMMKTLNRMSFGFLGQDVILESGAHGAMRARFGPRLASQFRYRSVEMVMEKDGMKLLMIR